MNPLNELTCTHLHGCKNFGGSEVLAIFFGIPNQGHVFASCFHFTGKFVVRGLYSF
jgi:hypothetical protein